MMPIFVRILLVLFVIPGCSEEQKLIPSGNYYTESGGESIEVREDLIHFRVLLDPKDPGTYLDRTWKHAVWPSGRIMPYPMASEEYAAGIGRFSWHWDGEEIIQTDPRDKARPAKRFVRRAG